MLVRRKCALKILCIGDIPRVVVPISSDQVVYARDPTIDLENMPEQVPNWLLVVLAYIVPMSAHIFMMVLSKFNRVRKIPHDSRDFTLSILISAGLAFILTTFIKNITGRLRPSFYDMCGWDKSVEWDGVSNLCTSSHEKEGRKSFPSGHSSGSFSGLFLLTLYLLGRSRLVAPSRVHCQIRSGKRLLKLFLCFAPTLLATWISITRSIDNWHHFSDILAGALIGIASATVAYSYNYAGIFSHEAAGLPLEAYYAKSVSKRHGCQSAQISCSQTCPQEKEKLDLERSNSTDSSMMDFEEEVDPSSALYAAVSTPVDDDDAGSVCMLEDKGDLAV